MPDTYTTNLSLTLPEIGASRDSWGAKTNDNWNIVDEFLFMAMPIGVVLDYAGAIPPDGWLACDGRLISRTTYSQLFSVLGTVWGAGDGSTTFRLPPTSGRASVGPGNVIDETGATVAFTFAQIRGAVARPIAQGHLPAVAVATDVQGFHGHGGAVGYGGTHNHTTDVQGGHVHIGAYTPTHSHSGWTDAQGAHNHTVGLWGMSAGTSGGGYGVMSDVFGAANYTTSTFPAHTHAVGTYESGNLTIHVPLDGNHGHNISQQADHTHALSIYGDGSHQHTITLGSGAWFDIMAPVVVVTKIIYAGQQASSRAITGAAAGAGPTRHLAAPSRGRH